jgi:hypothetical protein
MRYFASSPNVYEQGRLALDAAFGHPGPAALTAIDPAENAVKNKNGECLLAVWDEFLSFDAVQSLLLPMLESGAVREISRDDYHAALPLPLP